jgi:hypothetical protein
VTGDICFGANGGEAGAYSDPHGTVFVDRQSHAGAWADYLQASDKFLVQSPFHNESNSDAA